MPEPLPGLRRRAIRSSRARCGSCAAIRRSDGAWYGRWGVNYIYGTWQVLRGLALHRRGPARALRAPRRALAARTTRTRDGGWGESIASYDDPAQTGVGASTPSQTAWAVMGLLAAGEERSTAVRRGIRHLLERQDAAGTWSEASVDRHRVSQGLLSELPLYRHYFPLMALAQYRRATAMSEARGASGRP